MKLDYTSLANAIAAMERTCRYVDGRISSDSIGDDEMEVLKAAVIQNFEFTYELCWKFIKRWLDANFSDSFTSGLGRKQLFRFANENRLIKGFEDWMVYHELRNRTSHTYDRAVADEIFAGAPAFLQDAKLLLKRLESSDV